MTLALACLCAALAAGLWLSGVLVLKLLEVYERTRDESL